MNSTTDARSALRDLFQFHFGSHAWVPVLLAALAIGALALLLGAIMGVWSRPRLRATGVPSVYRIPSRDLLGGLNRLRLCRGFIMGWLYVPRA